MSEGAAVVVLEELEHAQKRNAHIYGEIIGYSTAMQGDVLSSEPSSPEAWAEGIAACVEDTIASAEIDPQVIDYLNARGNERILAELPKLTLPVTLLRAPPGENLTADFSASPTWPELASALPCCREIYLPGHNHFIPMQDPELVARYIREALQEAWQP